MGRNKDRLVIVIVTICYWVCQNGVKGNTLRHSKSENDKYKEVSTSVEEREKNIEDSEDFYGDTNDLRSPDVDYDTTTLFKRIKEMPLKIGLQLLAAKYGLKGSLDKTRLGGAHIYHGAKDAVKTMTGLIVDGIGNARYVLFGTK